MGKKQDLSKRRMEALRRGDLETADKLLRELMPRQRRDREAHELEKVALRARRSQRLRDRNTYSVEAGDSFFSVAGDVLGDMRLAGALIEANPNVYVLHPGMEINLPDGDTETEEPALFSEEAYRDALISQELVDAIGGDPSGARVGDEAVEIEADKAFVQESQEALVGLGMTEDALAEAVVDLLINLGYANEVEPKPREVLPGRDEGDLDLETIERQDHDTEETLGADVRFEDGPGQDDPPPTPDVGGKHGGKKVEGKGTSEAEPAVVPTEDVEPTEAVPEEVLSYAELVTADRANWGQWQSAFDDAGIAWQDAEGNLDIETVSTFIAEDIETNKERYAQELGVGVDELAEVSKERVEIWLEAAELHGQLDVFNTSLLLKQNDQKIFGVTVTANGLSMDDYKEQYVQFPDSQPLFDQTRNNMNAAFINIGFALISVVPQFNDPGEAFRTVFLDEVTGEGVTIDFDANRRESGCETDGRSFTCNLQELVGGNESIDAQLIAHEMGHVFETEIGRVLRGYTSEQQEYLRRQSLLQPRGILDSIVIYDENGEPVAGQGVPRDNLGMREDWLQNTGDSPAEEFADMFTHWVLGGFTDDPAGQALDEWFGSYAPLWVEYATQDFNPAWIEEEETRRQDSDE